MMTEAKFQGVNHCSGSWDKIFFNSLPFWLLRNRSHRRQQDWSKNCLFWDGEICVNSITKNKKPEEMKRFRKRRVIIGRQGLEGLPWWLSGKESACIVETWVWSLGWEDPLEEGMATHSSILAWKILRIEEPGGLKSMVSQRAGHDWATNTSLQGLGGVNWVKILSEILWQNRRDVSSESGVKEEKEKIDKTDKSWGGDINEFKP